MYLIMIKKNCLNCGKEFCVNNYRKDTAKCCSRVCVDIFSIGKRKSQYGFPKGHIPWQKGKPGKVNSGSFKKGQVSPLKGKRHYAVMGNKNPNWKGGVTSLGRNIRELPEMINWRKSILEDDDYTCRKCERRGGNMHVDHFPVQFALILRKYSITSIEKAILCKELWDTKNGRTLCIDCHKQTDTYMKKLLN